MHWFKGNIQKTFKIVLEYRLLSTHSNSMVLVTDLYIVFTLQLPQLTNPPLSLSFIIFFYGVWTMQ